MVSTHDNGCILLSADATTNERLVIRFDSLGNLVWSRTFSHEPFTHISAFSNGNFLLNTDHGSNTNYFTVIDSIGQIIKNRKIDGALNTSGIDFITDCPSPSCNSVAYLGYYDNNYSIGNALIKSDSTFSFDCYVSPYPDSAYISTIILTTSITPVYVYPETISMQLKNLECIRDTVAEVNFCSLSTNEKISEKPIIKIYPSPVTTQENIHLEISNLDGANTISIYDATGKIIQELNKDFIISTDTTIEINTSGLTGGVYFIRITDKKNKLIGAVKFVVN
jgi:hypothetical protein